MINSREASKTLTSKWWYLLPKHCPSSTLHTPTSMMSSRAEDKSAPQHRRTLPQNWYVTKILDLDLMTQQMPDLHFLLGFNQSNRSIREKMICHYVVMMTLMLSILSESWHSKMTSQTLRHRRNSCTTDKPSESANLWIDRHRFYCLAHESRWGC